MGHSSRRSSVNLPQPRLKDPSPSAEFSRFQKVTPHDRLVGFKNSKGLSLMELLIVVAVVGILVAFLMTTVQRMRSAGQAAHCANNLRQIGVGASMYFAEHDGWMPIARDQSEPGSTSYSSFGVWYWHLAPYLEIPRDENRNDRIGPVGPGGGRLSSSFVLLCPSHHEARDWSNFQKEQRPVSYAPTIMVAGASSSIQIAADGDGIYRGRLQYIERPSEKVFIIESRSHQVANMTSPHRWDPNNAPNHWGYLSFDRHQGTGNVLFFDGRVERFAAEELRAEKLADRNAFYERFRPWP